MQVIAQSGPSSDAIKRDSGGNVQLIARDKVTALGDCARARPGVNLCGTLCDAVTKGELRISLVLSGNELR